MKKLYLIFIALFLCNLSWGQTTTVTIGSGTSTHLFNPINPNFNFSYSQSLFTASELSTGGAIAGQSINAIRFYWGGTGNLNNSNTWVVYLGNTSQSVFSSTTNWIALSALTQVYNGTVSLPGSAGWMTINLTTPYIWDGSSNIVVATDENVSGYASSPANWRYTSTTPNNRAIYYYSDGTNPDPASPPIASGISYQRNNIQFDFITTASCLFPNSVAATNINYTTANINWNAPSTPPANGYQYEVRTIGTAGSGATGLVSSGTEAAGVTTTSISGLSGSTTYYCYVRSDCGSGDYSAWASGNFATLSCNIPTSVASSNISSSTATISWTAPVTGSPSGYEYEVRTSGAAGSGTTGLVTSGSTTSPTVSASLTGLTDGNTYYIYVRSICYTGYYSNWTSSASFKIPLYGTKTIKLTGGNYSSFTAAINSLNTYGVGTGGVAFIVDDGFISSENCPVITATGTASNTIVFQKSGTGNNPKITPFGTIGTSDAGIIIQGGDYITFEGIDIDASAVTALEYGYLIRNATATDGAQFNTIKNCAITLNRGSNSATSSSSAIFQTASTTAGGVVPTNATGANSYNKYYNLNIQNALNGVYLNGNASYRDMSCEVGTTSASLRNTISNLGPTSNTSVFARGIYAINQEGVKIFNNDISSVAGDQAATYGIYFTTCFGTSNEINNNKIHTINVKGSTSTSSAAYGLRADLSTTGTHNVRIYNNFISNIYTSYTSTATISRYAYGVFIGISSAGATQSYDIDNNSVSIGSGLTPTYSNTCYELLNSSPSLRFRGNIFANYTNAQTGVAKHFCAIVTAAGIGGSGTVLDYNDYYIANSQGTSGHVGRNGSTSTNYNAIADWKTFTTGTLDENSLSSDPSFTNNNTDLHVFSIGLNAVSGFSTQTWVTTDIDGENRSSLTPSDIGADAFNIDCTGAVGGTASGTIINCGSFTPTITASTYSLGSGSTYQWEYSNDNFVSDINDFVGQTTPATLTAGVVSTTTYYRLKVTCNTGTATAYSNIVSVTIQPVPTATASSNSPICSGNTLNITGTTDVGTSYSWTGPNGFTSTLQNLNITNATAAASGVYSYTATLNGCNSTVSSTTVAVNPVPVSVTASSSATTICAGSSIDLTSSAVSNADNLINYSEGFETWSPSNWTFINAGSGNQWATSTIFHTGSKSMYYNYNASYAANAWGITPGFSLASGTTYTITFWYKVASATYPEKLKVTVGNATTVIAQSTILWNNNGGSSLTNTNWAQGTTTFTPSSAGTYYLGFNCYSIADMSSLYVDDISINGGVLNPATFSWSSNPSGFTSSNQNPTGVILSENTQYTVTAQNIYGCTATANTTVNVDPATVAGSVTATTSPILGGQNAELTLSGNTGDIVKWQKTFNNVTFADVSPASTANPYSSPPDALGTWSYRAVVQSGVCLSANSVQADVLVNANSTTFSGATDNEWNTTANWSNGVPNNMYNVIIPVGLTNYPTLANPTTINNLTIKSDAGGTASLITNAALTVSGNTTVERYIAKDNKWHFLSSPVAAQAIKPNFAPTVADATFDFFKWDETDAPMSAPWTNIRNLDGSYATGFDNFEIGKGYLVAYSSSYTGSATHEFTGNLNNGDQLVTVSNMGNTYNLIGNPFASAINWDNSTLITNTSVTMGSSPSIWVWNNTNGNYGTYNNDVTGTLNVTNIIAPHQGFFVKANTSGSFTIPNSARVHTSNNFIKSTPSDLLRLKVSSTANNYCDEIIVNFKSNATTNEGSAKWFSMIVEAPSLYSVKNAKNLTINTLQQITTNITVPVSFKAGVNGNYSINASELNSFAAGTYIYLKDLKTNTIKDLNQNAIYAFTGLTTDNADRFQLIFSLSPLGISNNNEIQNTSIYSYNNTIYVNSNETIKQIAIYNTLGQLIKTLANTNDQINIDMNGNATGYYIVKVVTNKNVYSEKVLVK